MTGLHDLVLTAGRSLASGWGLLLMAAPWDVTSGSVFDFRLDHMANSSSVALVVLVSAVPLTLHSTRPAPPEIGGISSSQFGLSRRQMEPLAVPMSSWMSLPLLAPASPRSSLQVPSSSITNCRFHQTEQSLRLA